MARKSKNPVSRLFHKLVEARWFFAFSASVSATIIGISLTFGINSCREAQRARREMQKSMLQAVDNLGERLEDAQRWIDIILNEDRIYSIADSLYKADGTVPDSICLEFYNSVPYVRLAAFDHEFEKIYRGSYQLWQLQSANDSLAFYISQCYDGVNIVESTCEKLSEGLVDQLGIINATKNFFRQDPEEWTMTLITDPRFQYFMSIRGVKSSVAAGILEQVIEDYDRNVLPRSQSLRNE